MIKREDILKDKPVIIAGPCAVESQEQIGSIALKLKDLGVKILRAQLWKPRTTPNSFQGVGYQGVEWLKKIKAKTGLLIATEIVDGENIEMVKDVADILWVGARNMQNFELLKKIGKDPRVVILKNGLVANIKEWLGAAEYIGFDKVIMCERGVRSGCDSMRFTLDINSALIMKHDKGFPVIIDPSHSAGRSDMVPPLAFASIASGVDGVVVEVHENPTEALSDADQQITPEVLKTMIEKINQIYSVVHQD